MPFFTSANVVINEIAWMGSKVDGIDSNKWQYYEWIELYNDGNDAVDLTGWILSIVGKKDISLENTIPAGSFYFIERSGYHAFDNITADLATSFGTGLPNSGAILVLKDAAGNPVDTVDGSNEWRIGGGDIIGNNTTKETAQRTFSGWITATATPKATNAGVSEPAPEQSQSQSQSSEGSSSYVPSEDLPQIKAYAGKDRTVTVGANVEFRGQAFGFENEPLDNARYLWTFGDGASREGQNITHIYQYPGEYVVALTISPNISLKDPAVSDYLLVKAIPNQVFISEIKTGPDSFIELENKSKEEIDISGCQIKYNNQSFIFPASTRIRPNAYLVIPSSVSGMIFYDGKGTVELFYSGGFKADNFIYDGFPSSSESFNRMDSGSSIGLATPAAKNSSESVKNSVFNKNDVSAVQNSSETSEKSSEQEDKNKDNAQSANIITIGDNANTKSNTLIYLLAISGLVLFSGGAVLFIRRRGTLTKP